MADGTDQATPGQGIGKLPVDARSSAGGKAVAARRLRVGCGHVAKIVGGPIDVEQPPERQPVDGPACRPSSNTRR